MDVSEAVEFLDFWLKGETVSNRLEAWQTLKPLVLAQLYHNSGSTKCLCETCENLFCEGMAPSKPLLRVKFTVHECDGFTKSLLAGA